MPRTDFDALYDSLTLDMAQATARLDAATTYQQHRLAQVDYTDARDARQELVKAQDPAGYAREEDWQRMCAGHHYCHS